MFENVDLDWLAKIASILTFVITLIGAIVGIGGMRVTSENFGKAKET